MFIHIKSLSDAIPIFNKEVKFIVNRWVYLFSQGSHHSTHVSYIQAGRSRYFKQNVHDNNKIASVLFRLKEIISFSL